MKININKVNTTPKDLPFNLCVYNNALTDEIKLWITYHNFKTEPSSDYINIITPDDIDFENIFEPYTQFKYFDGFSPNLNKHLHLGHLSNLIIAKAIQSFGLTDITIAILGDTLSGDINKEDALKKYQDYLSKFAYTLDRIYYASEQKLSSPSSNHYQYPTVLVDGENQYKNTKVFVLGDEKIVGIKSDGDTTYFYQDVALQQLLNAKTLYLTGDEQNNHFRLLKKQFPYIEHKGLGLILLDGKKMSSSEGNVIFAEDILKELGEKLKGDDQLVYNVLAGQILAYAVNSKKNILLKNILNVKNSKGLYLSYTLARMYSAGINFYHDWKFSSKKLNYALFRSKYSLEPNILFNALIEVCEEIGKKYETHQIKGNEKNEIMFQTLTSDLIYGCYKLGLFLIKKV